ncbi:MAG: hypothetical protein ACYDEY_06915, partial [Acidimicrobiales bacterium]
SNCSASILADLAEELQVMSRETSPLHVLKARLAGDGLLVVLTQGVEEPSDRGSAIRWPDRSERTGQRRGACESHGMCAGTPLYAKHG